MSEYYSRDGSPMTMDEWAKATDDNDNRRVAEDWPEGYWVSTIWLGLNHQFGDGPPLIFETMVFPAKDGKVTDWAELAANRYSTEKEALAGHKKMVAKFSGEVVTNG